MEKSALRETEGSGLSSNPRHDAGRRPRRSSRIRGEGL